MVKECRVILNNDAVTVVRFDNIDIQFPSIKKDAKTVLVSYENNEYLLVDKSETVKAVSEKPKQKVTKKKAPIQVKVTDEVLNEI